MSHTNGGDMTETVECPGCGRQMANTRWPVHFKSCGSGAE
jgi:hypothetical protein